MFSSIKKKLKKFLIYCDLIFNLSLNILPSQSIFFFPPPKDVHLKTFSHDLKMQFEVCKVIENQNELNFSESEMNDLYQIYIKLISNLVTREEFKNRLVNFRGNDLR